jgi:hypothetical protein
MNFDISKCNIGSTDRLIRVAVAILLIIGALLGGTWIAGLIGAILLGTAYFRFCPAYGLFGITTNKEMLTEHK